MKKIVVIGGTNHDIFAYTYQQAKMNDSNPGYLKDSFGGVGRNIAENLARLDLSPTFITAIGKDIVGQDIIDSGSKLGIHFDVIEVETTPTYVAVVDQNKDMLVAVAAMDELEQMTVDQIKGKIDFVNQADLLILDTNFNQTVLSYIFNEVKIPICVDAISTHKAQKIVHFYSQMKMLKLNLFEAKTLSGLDCQTKEDIEKIGFYFCNQGVGEIYITLGDQGAYRFDGKSHQFISGRKISIVNTTGAGDAFFAGVIYAFEHQMDALSCGMAAALITLQDSKAVSSNLNQEQLLKTIKEYQL
ncbi:MAG: carbohydrate kinase family protein [Firmicutes bacterium]|nr:carbohydrate kinase family protein [Bacillota bacterium]